MTQATDVAGNVIELNRPEHPRTRLHGNANCFEPYMDAANGSEQVRVRHLGVRSVLELSQ